MGANQIRKTSQLKKDASSLQICSNPYPNIKFRYTSTVETEKMIKPLK
jgi:hypothetical protein